MLGTMALSLSSKATLLRVLQTTLLLCPQEACPALLMAHPRRRLGLEEEGGPLICSGSCQNHRPGHGSPVGSGLSPSFKSLSPWQVPAAACLFRDWPWLASTPSIKAPPPLRFPPGSRDSSTQVGCVCSSGVSSKHSGQINPRPSPPLPSPRGRGRAVLVAHTLHPWEPLWGWVQMEVASAPPQAGGGVSLGSTEASGGASFWDPEGWRPESHGVGQAWAWPPAGEPPGPRPQAPLTSIPTLGGPSPGSDTLGWWLV